jgi:hypothetical protein
MAGTRRAAMGVALMVAAVSWTTSCSAGDSEYGSALDTGPLDVTTSTLADGSATTPAPPPGAPTTPGPAAGPGAAAPPPGAAAGPVTGLVGQPVQSVGYEVTVHEVQFPAAAPDPAATPAPGHMLLSVDLELTNLTRGDRDATYLRVEVVDAGGTVYEASPHGDRLPTGWIPPNDPQRLVQIYEVPMLAAGLTLTLRPDLVSEIAVAVTLS